MPVAAVQTRSTRPRARSDSKGRKKGKAAGKGKPTGQKANTGANNSRICNTIKKGVDCPNGPGCKFRHKLTPEEWQKFPRAFDHRKSQYKHVTAPVVDASAPSKDLQDFKDEVSKQMQNMTNKFESCMTNMSTSASEAGTSVRSEETSGSAAKGVDPNA